MQKLTDEIARLTEAIAMGEPMVPLVDALKRRQAQRDDLTATITAIKSVDVWRVDRVAVARTVRTPLDEWRAVLRDAAVEPKRQLFRKILGGMPLVFAPKDGVYHFEGELVVGSLLIGQIGLPTNMVRPA